METEYVILLDFSTGEIIKIKLSKRQRKESESMKAVIQRVTGASVTVDGQLCGACHEGLLILLGAARGDTASDAELLLQKIVKLRIFCDEAGKMNRSV